MLNWEVRDAKCRELEQWRNILHDEVHEIGGDTHLRDSEGLESVKASLYRRRPGYWGRAYYNNPHIRTLKQEKEDLHEEIDRFIDQKIDRLYKGVKQ